jgi:hypothetical protein
MNDESSTDPPWIQTMGGSAGFPASRQCRRTPFDSVVSGIAARAAGRPRDPARPLTDAPRTRVRHRGAQAVARRCSRRRATRDIE